MPRKKPTTPAPRKFCAPPYTVYVTYPSSSKQYAYLCDIPGVDIGCNFMINNALVTVRRIIDGVDPVATKWVPGSRAVAVLDRAAAIRRRLHEIEKAEAEAKRFASLTSPEAKRLVRELKELSK